MEFPLKGFPGQAVLKDGAKEIAHATLPQVRLLRVEHTAVNFPANDIRATWTTCTPETAAEFSAVAYFFGRAIQQQEQVPVGLIDSTWGGTPVEAWTGLDAISADGSLMPAFATWARFADAQTRLPEVICEGEARGPLRRLWRISRSLRTRGIRRRSRGSRGRCTTG